MSRAMPTNDCVDHINIKCSTINIKKDKKYKDKKVKEIIEAICALLNSNGGKVELCSEKVKEKQSSTLVMSSLVRTVEQSIISIIGVHHTVSHLNFIVPDKERIIIEVSKSFLLATIDNNFYLPTETQVVQASNDSLEAIRECIISRRVVEHPVLLGSQRKTFVQYQNCGFWESKHAQFRLLKASPSKRVTLADRITGKSNKFSCYVCAFANHNGGHIYYGITDDGVVEGEFISNTKEIIEITEKVKKAINKMIWPEEIGQPKRGVQWDIFFEPVIDESSKPIPLTFVIVIFIAPCLGGVFTEEPKSYEMVEEKVKRMSFPTWKKRLIQPDCCRRRRKSKEEEIPRSVGRLSWSTKETCEACTFADGVLMQCINNGEWDAILRKGEYFKKKRPQFEYEMKLLLLSKFVTASYRRGKFNEAENFLKSYTSMLHKARDREFFESIKLYLTIALKRASKDQKKLKELLAEALSKAEIIEPGLVSAIVYIITATVIDLACPEDQSNSPEVLSIKALEHLQRAQDSLDSFAVCRTEDPRYEVAAVLADMEQKSHITLASFYLSYNISGHRFKEIVDDASLDKAKTSIMAIRKSDIYEGNPVSCYREVQLKLVESIYHFRSSQVFTDRKDYFLRNAFEKAKMAERLAKEHQFEEMFEWSKANQVVFTEELVRAKISSIRERVSTKKSD